MVALILPDCVACGMSFGRETEAVALFASSTESRFYTEALRAIPPEILGFIGTFSRKARFFTIFRPVGPRRGDFLRTKR